MKLYYNFNVKNRTSKFYKNFSRLETRIEFTFSPNQNAPQYNHWKIQEEVNSRIKSMIDDEIKVMERETSNALTDSDQMSIRIITDTLNDLYTKQYFKNFEYDEIFEIVNLNLKFCGNDITLDVFIQIT